MKRRGSVFVLALVVLTAATTILALTVSAQRVNFQSTINRMEAKRARLMAESGIQRALAELQAIDQTGEVDQSQTWYSLGDRGNESFTVSGESFRFEIVDAGSLINLNVAPEQQLQSLGLTQAQIDSLLDWREQGENARAEGAKDDYYNNLEKPYNAKQGRLDSLDEVLLIKDWIPNTLLANLTESSVLPTPRPLYALATTDSFSPNTDGTGQQRQNINVAQQQQLIQAGLSAQVAQAIIARRNGVGQFASMNQVFATPGLDVRSAGILLDRYSVSQAARVEGKINLNTATEDVLATVPGLTSDLAQAVVSRQATPLANLSEVLQVPGISINLLSQMADYITVGSDTFIVRSQGRAGSTTVSLEAAIRVNNGSASVLKMTETLKSNMIDLWGWAQDSTSDTVLGEDQR